MALGAFIGVHVLTKLEYLPDVEVNPGMPDDLEIEIPEDMAANLGDLLDGGGAVCGSAFDDAGVMIEDIDVGAAGEHLGNALEGAKDAMGEIDV